MDMHTQTINLPVKDIAAFCKCNHIHGLVLFDSSAKGNFLKGSDLDLPVDFEHDAQIGFMPLSPKQQELSGSMQRKVDLIPKGGLKPIPQQEILPTMNVPMQDERISIVDTKI